MDDDIRFVLERDADLGRGGLLARRFRDSHRIAALLQGRGYRVIPVNPDARRDARGALRRERARHEERSRSSTSSGAPRRPARTSTRRSRSAPRQSGCSSA